MTLLSGLRVLAVHPSPDLYGSDRMLIEALSVLQSAGALVELVMPAQGRLNEVVGSAIEIHTLDFPVLRKALLAPSALGALTAQSWRVVAELRGWLRRLNPDLLYVNTITLPHWLVAARLERIPSVCHVRELESQLPSLAASALLSPLLLADTLVVNSEATQRFLAQRLRPLGHKSCVLYNGFNFDATWTEPAFESPVRLALVGRLSPRKGQDVALDALRLLLEDGHDVNLEFVGDAFAGYEEYEQALKGRAEAIGRDRVTFAGFCPEPSRAYERADVILVPSRLEPFGNVAVEGLAAGRPVIASRVGGLPEIVDHGVTGFLVPPDDSIALAEAISALISDHPTAVMMGEAGARTVRERFPMERFGTSLTSILHSVVLRRTGSSRPSPLLGSHFVSEVSG